MKMKIPLKKYAGLIVIAIMFTSTLAIAASQSFSGNDQPHNQQPTGSPQQGRLPGQTVIDYKMSQADVQLAVSRGFLVSTYEYSPECSECVQNADILSQIAESDGFQRQTILELVETEDDARLSFVSVFGQTEVEEITEESILDGFCTFATNPPLKCAVR